MIRILLVQSHRLCSEGTKAIIEKEKDMKVVGVTKNAEDTIQAAETIQPDIVIMDIHRESLDRITTTAKIKEQHPHIKVIFLGVNLKEECIFRGVNVGVDGFLLKDLYSDTLRRMIREVHRGEYVLSGEVANIIVKKIRELTKDKRTILGIKLENIGIDLTNRELDIAFLLMQDCTNQRIAQKLQIRDGTVKNYMSELYTKLNIHNREEAVKFLNMILMK